MKNTVKDFFVWKSKKESIEEKDNPYKDKWQKMDVLYSFIGIYTIGIYVFYPKKCKRTNYQIRQKNGDFFSTEYLSKNYQCFPRLNKVIEASGFISVYDTLGNVIPIWPGGNVDRGTRAQCFDIPEIYFCYKYPIWFDVLCINYPEANIQLINDENFALDTKCFLDSMSEEKYEQYLRHIVSVIKQREIILQGDKNEV